MKLNQELNTEQKQEQELVMTAELQQSIELLQFSTLELKEYIQEETLDNPLLELESNYGDSDYAPVNHQEVDYENFVGDKLTLNDYLQKQVNLVVADEQEREIAEYIIGSLDDCGFFTDWEVVSQELGVSKERVAAVLKKIKQVAPEGIAAADCQEALLIELEELAADYSKRKVELAKKIVADHLEDLEANKIRKIANNLGIKPEEAQQISDLISELDPVPANKFGAELSGEYLDPDIIVKETGTEPVIIMTEDSFPTLRINQKYRRLLEQEEAGGEIADYVKEKLQKALWLVRSIEQRRRTIYQVMQAIIDLQSDFFAAGIKHLRPLTMAEVAERIDKHESTVSRATTNKYVQTPYGLFHLKFFFAEGIKSGEQEIAAISVRHQIKEIVADEDKTNPLSDQQLADELAARGIELARRTVAKYRKKLQIPSSRQRKRYE